MSKFSSQEIESEYNLIKTLLSDPEKYNVKMFKFFLGFSMFQIQESIFQPTIWLDLIAYGMVRTGPLEGELLAF